jgi:hypothetical protein
MGRFASTVSSITSLLTKLLPVLVKLKHRADQWIDVGDSLKTDSELALNAWFLVDSESFIKVKRFE